MNSYNNNFLILFCFSTLLALTGCGLKGDLYQTPESIKGEGIVADKADKKENNQNSEKLNKKITDVNNSQIIVPAKSESQ